MRAYRAIKLLKATTRETGSYDRNKASLDALDTALMEFRNCCQVCWPGKFNTANVLTGKHYRESVDNFGVPALLSVVMQEMSHGPHKRRVRTTSGRDTLLELMEAESVREGFRYLWHVSGDFACAAKDPAIQRLPAAIRDALLELPLETNKLRALLLPRPVSTPYAEHTGLGPDATDFLRTGCVGAAIATDLDLHLLRALVGVDLDHEDVSSFNSLTLPHRPKRTSTLWADYSRKGFAHYAVDAPVDEKRHAGVVRLNALFMYEDEAFAKVSWGVKTALHSKTKFQGYSFPALTQEERRRTLNRVAAMPLHKRPGLQWQKNKRGEILLRADRLVQYVHFGCLDGGALVLNTHFIS